MTERRVAWQHIGSWFRTPENVLPASEYGNTNGSFQSQKCVVYNVLPHTHNTHEVMCCLNVCIGGQQATHQEKRVPV